MTDHRNKPPTKSGAASRGEEPAAHSFGFTVLVPITVTPGRGARSGDARQALDVFVRETLRPALEKLNGGPVVIHTDQIVPEHFPDGRYRID